MKHLKKILSIVLVTVMLALPIATVVSAAGLGDVFVDGKINGLDYMLVRRYCLKTTTLSDSQLVAADVNRDGKVDKIDYILIKRHCLKTYTIKGTTFDMVEDGEAVEFDDNIFYQYYDVTSGENGNTEKVVTLEFNPADGYIPMSFAAFAGTASLLPKHYEFATEKYGYEVKGIINGAFFSTTNGFLNGMLASNGKLLSTHAGLSEEVICFASDGTFKTVKSKLEYGLYINGVKVNDPFYAFNKTSGANTNWDNRFYYYDTSCGMSIDTYEECPGYEVICEKNGASELAIGTTLYGTVLEVRENSYGAALADDYDTISNKFVLFVKSNSPYAQFAEGLKADDLINITVNETIEESREIMENANSILSNLGPFNGWLVKDGVDLSQTNASIGSHDVTLPARWTAFGVKEDGTYVFMTSEGASTGTEGRSLTLRDVARIMIEKGCVNVIRMDGGGSSAMYVSDAGDGNPGYLQSSTRAVSDCIMVVRKTSLEDVIINEDLEILAANTETLLETNPNPATSAILDEVKELLKQDVIVSGDALRLGNELYYATLGLDELKALIDETEAASISDYSEENLDALRNTYLDALEVYLTAISSPEYSAQLATELRAALDKKGQGTLIQNAVYMTHFNASIQAGNVTFFTPDFGEISHATANHKWTHNMILTWDDGVGAYVVTEVFLGAGNAKTVNLEENQLFIALHNDEVTEASIQNAANFDTAQVGDKLVLHGIDIDSKTIGALAYITFE